MGLWASLRAAVGTAPASSTADRGAAERSPTEATAPGGAAAPGEVTHGPTIAKNACRACGACLDECPEGVFAMGRHDDTARVARPADCRPECDRCAATCPQDGISFPGR